MRDNLEHGLRRVYASVRLVVLAALVGSGCVSSKGCPNGQSVAGGACVPLAEVDADANADASTGGLVLAGDDAGPGAAGLDAGESADAAMDAGPCGGATPTDCWQDYDKDGFAALGAVAKRVCGGSCGSGWTKRKPTATGNDCRAQDPDAHPDALDACNDLDDDCDGSVDEGASATCEFDHAAGACTGGVCKLGACDDGFDDCDGDGPNGCETALNVAGNCGACGVGCHQLASCDDSTATGVCTCDAPHFGDGNMCHYIGATALGTFHTCAIKSDRSVSCWGIDTSNESSPPNPLGGFIEVAAAGSLSCGLKAGGGLACWGATSYGAVTPPALGDYVQVVAGNYHACALRTDHTAVCWGIQDGSAFDYGQTAPPNDKFRQLASGTYHSCGLHEDGSVVCWGGGSVPGCASATDCGQSVVPDPALHRFVQITAGIVHTCGLKANGSVMCWGAGVTDTDVSPHYGQSAPPGGASFAYISAGALHTCGVTTSQSVVCWGAGDYDGATGSHQRQSLPPIGTFITVHSGGFHTCGLTSTLAMKCWGYDNSGQTPASIAGTWPLIP